MDKLPISVIIVARNAERTIDECLSSVQRNNPAEIIVVDGDSSDSTVDIARRYTERVYSDGGKGLGYARQLGAEMATQEYLAYVDSDVVLLGKGALATMLTEFQSSEYVSIRALESPDKKCSTYWEWGDYQHQHYSRLRSRQDYLTTMACLIRRETVLRYRFDVSEKYFDDLDLGMRLGREGHKFGTSSALYYHRHRRSDFKNFASYRFFLGWTMSFLYICKYGPWHISLWAPTISLYWLGFFLIRGNLKIIPYLLVDSAVLNAGWMKGFFDMVGEALKKSKTN